jgi:hypothetical protein
MRRHPEPIGIEAAEQPAERVDAGWTAPHVEEFSQRRAREPTIRSVSLAAGALGDRHGTTQAKLAVCGILSKAYSRLV